MLSEDLRAEMLTGMCAEDSRLGVDTCQKFGREPGWRTFETMEAIQTKYPGGRAVFRGRQRQAADHSALAPKRGISSEL